MRKLIIFSFVFITFSISLSGQISPPGLGNANTAGWMAIGFRQALDSAGKKQSITYIGLGRTSAPDHDNPYEKQAIVVINEEFYNQFHKHWQYSLALSYRRQNEYADSPPYGENVPGIQQEFRIYGRYSYVWQSSRLKVVTTLRQEFRKFYTPDFKDMDESLQLRSRFRGQLTFNLDRDKVHRIITSAEALFSVSREGEGQKQWRDFNYRESRFCLYYSYDPPKSALVYNIGYMNDLLGTSAPADVHYLAIDVIWENPFANLKRRKKKPIEYLE